MDFRYTFAVCVDIFIAFFLCCAHCIALFRINFIYGWYEVQTECGRIAQVH